MTEERPIDIEMREAEESIKKQFYSCIPLFILAVGIPLAAYNAWLIPISETEGSWFQRSGSLAVLFAVWMEYNLMKVNEYITLPGIAVSEQIRVSDKYKRTYKVLQYSAIVLVFIGTFIWGYGDLFK